MAKTLAASFSLLLFGGCHYLPFSKRNLRFFLRFPFPSYNAHRFPLLFNALLKEEALKWQPKRRRLPLKPTFSSKPEITSKYVKKSSVVHNDDSSAQKDRIQRVRSFDKSLVGSPRVKPMASSTQKPGGSRPVKPSPHYQPPGPTRAKKAPHPVPTIVSSAPESLSTSPTKCKGSEFVKDEDADAIPARVYFDEPLTGEKLNPVDNEIVRADEPVDDASMIPADEVKNLTIDEFKIESLEDLESEILEEEESQIVPHAEEINREKIIIPNEEIPAETATDAEQLLQEETSEPPPIHEGASEVEPVVEVKEEPTATIEKSEASDQATSAVQKKQVVQSKKEAPSAYNDVIEETKNKLLEKKKNKVKALVGAFETVIDYESASK